MKSGLGDRNNKPIRSSTTCGHIRLNEVRSWRPEQLALYALRDSLEDLWSQ